MMPIVEVHLRTEACRSVRCSDRFGRSVRYSEYLADPRIPHSAKMAPVGPAAAAQYIQPWQDTFEAPVPLSKVLRIAYVQFG